MKNVISFADWKKKAAPAGTDDLNDRQVEAITAIMNRATKGDGPRTRTYLREWRTFQGYDSVSRFAARLGVSVMLVSRIEHGQRQMTSDFMAKAAEALGIEPGDLFKAPPSESASA